MSKTKIMAVEPQAFLDMLPLLKQHDTLPPYASASGEAVIDISGSLSFRGWGMTYAQLKTSVSTALADSTIRSLTLQFDTCGGETRGLFTACNHIVSEAAKWGKPVKAVVKGDCYSAGYALACACSSIEMEPDAKAGSIGVAALREDFSQANASAGVKLYMIASSAQKFRGDPNTAATPEELAEIQQCVDREAEKFFAWVAARRGLTVDAVRALDAGTFSAAEAVSLGLADVGPNQLITSTTQEPSVDLAAIVEALRKIAADDSDPDQAKAKALLDSLEAPAEDEPAEEAKAETKAEEPGDKDKDESDKGKESDEDEDKKASGVSVSVNASAESIAELAAKFEASQAEIANLRAKLEGDRKDKLFASFKVSAELKDFLSPKPLAEVEAILKHMKPQPAVNAALSGTVKTVAGKPELSAVAKQVRIEMGLDAESEQPANTDYSQTFIRKVK